MKSLLIKLLFGILLIFPNFLFAQSIHQDELSSFNQSGLTSASDYELASVDSNFQITKAGCDLTKMVYGWHPYWVGSAYQNYRWDLLSHLSFFSYDVDYSTGNATSTHGWSTSAAVNTALATGTTKVTLCVTLFSNHSSFLTNPTAKQTLISNLISLISSRGAHGVNIDFEGLPSSQATNFANFMVDLSNQMHTSIPGSEVSTVLYSVDWNSVFNFSIMEPEVDYYIIMGYDYYYSGSTTAGPNDPLYQFGTSYNYTLSRSLTEYLKAGCPRNKLILGLPNYGREWSTSSLNVPSSTTATGVSRTYSYTQNNSTGFYTPSNHIYENESESDVYKFMNGSTPKQCFITEEGAFDKRLDHVLNAGIGGIGIWALGYDDGYDELWNSIENKLTDCHVDACSGNIHDFGGPAKNYYNNENYTWTISPPNATSLDVNFSLFDVELNYDYLYIYDGNSISAPQIPGSPFTGTVSPGLFSTSSGSVTFRFTSDISTVKPGFLATYTCNQDDVPPTTDIVVAENWQTNDFDVSYTDSDNQSVSNRFSLITDYDGNARSANRNLGYLYEDFSTSLTNQWTTGLGTWNLNSGWLNQSDEVEANTACNSTLTQDNSGKIIYSWKGKIGGSGTNRRAGIHFFCSDLVLPNKGNSYLIYWRADSDKCQIYKSTNDNLVLQTNDDIVVDPTIEYNFKILYDPNSGVIEAFLDDVMVSSWTDSSPLTSGVGVSIRSGNCTWNVDDFKVFKERNTLQNVTIGSVSDMVRFQNTNPLLPSCKIFSLVQDNSEIFSTISEQNVNIDWTTPSSVIINDGLSNDIDVFVNPNEISSNWTNSIDSHSEIDHYEISVGTIAGNNDIVSPINIGNSNVYTFTGLNLTVGQTYFINIKTINGANLETSLISSDGQTLQNPSSAPIANFQSNQSVICLGDSILLTNTSTDGTSFLWSTNNGIINNNSDQNVYLIPSTSGIYQVTLTALNSAGSDQITQNVNLTVLDGPIASANPDNDQLSLPNAIVLFSNTSQNADSYFWDFGDGESSLDLNPWHQYSQTGVYTVMLVALQNGCLNDTTYFEIQVGNAGNDDNISLDLIVYPNPSSGEVCIKGERIEKVEIYDMNGKKLFYKDYKLENKINLKLSESINQGVYLMKILANERVSNVRFVVINH